MPDHRPVRPIVKKVHHGGTEVTESELRGLRASVVHSFTCRVWRRPP